MGIEMALQPSKIIENWHACPQITCRIAMRKVKEQSASLLTSHCQKKLGSLDCIKRESNPRRVESQTQ